MKKISQLMRELGFNDHAPVGVKEAFIKHLIKASEGVNVMTPSEKKMVLENPQQVVPLKIPVQLSFEFIENASTRTTKKAVS